MFFTFYIHLYNSDREQSILNTLSDTIFNNTTKIKIEAIDGRKDDIYKYIETDETKSTNVEYACLISHFKAIHNFYNIGNYGDYAIIMEDDMTLDFKKYWNKSFKQIINEAPLDWEIIQLSYISHYIPKNVYEPILYNNKNALYGTGAYIIKYEVAKRFIDKLYDKIIQKYIFKNIKEPSFVYHIADHYIYSFNRTYCYKYCPFIYKYNQISTINTNHIDFHNKSRNQIEKLLNTIKHNNNIEELIWKGITFFNYFLLFNLLISNI